MKIAYLASCALAGAVAGLAFVGASPVLGVVAAVFAASACASGLKLLRVA